MPHHSVAAIVALAVAAAPGSAALATTALASDTSVASAGQKTYKEWTIEELLPAVNGPASGRDWKRGRELFRKVACGVCHAFASESEGTGLAPDLTGVGSTYDRRFILESILQPSATINPRFSQTKFTLKNGDVVTGSVVDTAAKKIIVAPVMMNPGATVSIDEADVKSEEPASVSAMPAGLINELTREEIVELLAFLEAGGDPGAPIYRKK